MAGYQELIKDSISTRLIMVYYIHAGASKRIGGHWRVRGGGGHYLSDLSLE